MLRVKSNPPKRCIKSYVACQDMSEKKGYKTKTFFDNKNPCFSEFYSILDSRMKGLLQKGHVTTVKQVDPITQEKLWYLGVFGVSDSQILQYTVVFYA